MTETGWGEFEIQIKIFFQDPAEKPVTLFHHLRLYSTEETIMGPQNSVTSERYEEIVRDWKKLTHTQFFPWGLSSPMPGPFSSLRPFPCS